MTDEQIIKALEVHSNEKFDNCEGCPYLVGDFCEGFTKHSKPFRDVIDLINRQKADIERLDKLVIYNASCCTRLHKDLFNAKTEAIKEFAERLKFELEIAFDEPIFDTIIGNIIESTIDELLEELTHQPKKIEHNSLCETETYESR